LKAPTGLVLICSGQKCRDACDVRVAMLVPLIDAGLPPALALLTLTPEAGTTGQAFEKAATPSFRRVPFLKTSSDLQRWRLCRLGMGSARLDTPTTPFNLPEQIIVPAQHWLGSAEQGRGTWRRIEGVKDTRLAVECTAGAGMQSPPGRANEAIAWQRCATAPRRRRRQPNFRPTPKRVPARICT